MIILAPSTSAQTFNILPRSKDDLTGITLTITDESSKQYESFDLDSRAYYYEERVLADGGTFEFNTLLNEYRNIYLSSDDNYVTIRQEFSILKENRIYKIVLKKDGFNWWRGKAMCTSQTNYKLKHSLNTIASTQYLVIEDDETFTILP